MNYLIKNLKKTLKSERQTKKPNDKAASQRQKCQLRKLNFDAFVCAVENAATEMTIGQWWCFIPPHLLHFWLLMTTTGAPCGIAGLECFAGGWGKDHVNIGPILGGEMGIKFGGVEILTLLPPKDEQMCWRVYCFHRLKKMRRNSQHIGGNNARSAFHAPFGRCAKHNTTLTGGTTNLLKMSSSSPFSGHC